MESEIQELAAAHAKAAIAVLVEIMKNPRVPSRERLSAAKALLERAFGKATGQKSRQDAPSPVTPVRQTVVDPKPPGRTSTNPPLEGGSKFVSTANKFRGGVLAQTCQIDPSPKNASHFSTEPQGEGKSNNPAT